MVAGKLQTVSVVDALEEHLRMDIFKGKIEAGERIKESPLAKELEVSRHTLRAALSRLENVGLLEYRENRGWSVPQFGQEEYEDILMLRESLETTAYRVAVDKGIKPNAAVDAVIARMKVMTEETPWFERIEADCDLHQSLVDLAGSPRLSRAFADMMDEFRLCRMQSLEWLQELPVARWIEFHEKLVEDLKDENADPESVAGTHFVAAPWNAPRADVNSVDVNSIKFKAAASQ
ncbi:GntR family transcriptional regulator [Corynebacterium glutamicum MT]|uniref:GntR family transcriptional regulator n=2 Tax=Corynebacterium glutamicum TaxID=1718 RepID=A0AB36IER8_CORGT|nr:GntR family transcriptional regulator [Corynebacterium glutamicum S9114]EOA65984.1 GntR family transcriptional regulator [Corynebacterium glutamicum MT]OKX76971.1 GntR family transcriptional regulator [Corynebacterium glutamicum]OKX79388.1 GntR family transcriptional regulator [Corynebacterium glutamicum]TWS46313.1 GntR family transcriptional regulator [Corynebacterium glutamicum]